MFRWICTKTFLSARYILEKGVLMQLRFEVILEKQRLEWRSVDSANKFGRAVLESVKAEIFFDAISFSLFVESLTRDFTVLLPVRADR